MVLQSKVIPGVIPWTIAVSTVCLCFYVFIAIFALWFTLLHHLRLSLLHHWLLQLQLRMGLPLLTKYSQSLAELLSEQCLCFIPVTFAILAVFHPNLCFVSKLVANLPIWLPLTSIYFGSLLVELPVFSIRH